MTPSAIVDQAAKEARETGSLPVAQFTETTLAIRRRLDRAVDDVRAVEVRPPIRMEFPGIHGE